MGGGEIDVRSDREWARNQASSAASWLRQAVELIDSGGDPEQIALKLAHASDYASGARESWASLGSLSDRAT